MKGNVQNTTLWRFIAAAMVAFVPPLLLVERQTMFEIVDGLCVGACVGVLLGYGRSAWHAIKLPPHDLISGDYLVVGIGMVTLGGAVRFGGQWYWRAMGKPDWWIDSPVLLVATVGIVAGLFLILMTTSSKKGVLVPSAYFRASGLFVTSLAIATILIWAGWG